MTKLIRPSIILLYTFVLLLFALEIFTNPLVLEKRIGISTTFLAVIAGVIYLALRLRGIKLSNISVRISTLIILPLISIALVVFSNLESNNYTNYVLEHFRLHYKHLLNPLLFTSFMIFASQGKKWWTNNLEKFAFFLAFGLFLLALAISIWPFNIFLELVKEDGPIEFIQFLSFLTAGIISLAISFFLWKKYRLKFIAILYIVFSIGLIFIAGEEISWGQRYLHFTTPEVIAENNRQNELTFHNLSTFEGYVQTAYMLAGFYGSFVSLILTYFIKTKSVIKHLFILKPFLFPYFLAIFFYNFYTGLGDHMIGHWSEPAETMLALGIFFFALKNFLDLKLNKQKKK